MILKILTLFLPWSLRRHALEKWFGFKIHPKARIGMAWVFPDHLIMHADSRIDHFTVAINLDLIQLESKATIGRNNWITGFPTKTESLHFRHVMDRQAALRLGEQAAITKNHHIDCTSLIQIGRFATIAGYNSQLLTHSIDVSENRQDSKPIYIGEYAFVGTNVVLLGGSALPARSILGAKSLLTKSYSAEWTLYSGVPAMPIRMISQQAKYFNRMDGYVI